MKVQFKEWKCKAVGAHYATVNNAKAISLIDAEDGEPIATASINIVEDFLPNDEIFIKDYSENEGMVDALIKAGIIKPGPRKSARTTFVTISAYKLTPEAIQQLWPE